MKAAYAKVLGQRAQLGIQKVHSHRRREDRAGGDREEEQRNA